MVSNRNRERYMMVNPEQLATMKCHGCKTTTAVRSFCTRYNVGRVWYKPKTSNRRILMIDVKSFWIRWNEIYGQYWENRRTTGQRAQTPTTWRRKTTKHTKPKARKTTSRTRIYTITTHKMRRAA